MANQNDMRKFPRMKIILPVAVASGTEQHLDLANIDDLTVEGLSFLSDRPIAVRSDIYVVFPAGKSVGENEVHCEVIRCDLQKDSGKNKVVVRFVEPNDAFLMDALALIHEESAIAKKRGA